MPKKRVSKAKNQRPAKSKEALVSESGVQDILGVLLVVCAVAMIVAIVSPNQAPVTRACAEALELCFGVGAFLIPLAIALLAVTFFVPTNTPLSARAALGLSLVVLAVLTFVSLTIPEALQDPMVVLGESQAKIAGGWVGGAMAWALLVTVGRDVGFVVVVGAIVLGLVVCGFSISGFAVKLRQAKNSARERRAERNLEAQGDTLRRGEKPFDYSADNTNVLKNEGGETTFIGVRKTSVLHRRDPRPQPQLHPKATLLRPKPLPQEVATSGSWADPALSSVKEARAPRFDGTAALRLVGAPSSPTPSSAPFDTVEAREVAPVLKEPKDVVIPPFVLHFAEDTTKTSEQPSASRASRGKPASDALALSQSDLSTKDAKAFREAPKDAFSLEGSSAPALPVEPKEALASALEAAQTRGLPPLSMLTIDPQSGHASADDSELTATAERLQATLEEFGLKSRVVGWVSGPLVTTFKIEMGEGERVNRITNLEDDIALTLAAESVRIFAPIPGTSHVGIEIPNRQRRNVHLGDVLPHAHGGPLELAIGRDAEGKPVVEDLATMPHLLIAGATGSGKSVMINSIIMSLLMRTTAQELRLILIDPKRVELGGYNGLPHLYVPVVTEPKKASGALSWAVGEMERRLKLFEKAGARDIGVYNRLCQKAQQEGDDDAPEPIPYLVIIVDELSDLMMVAGKDVEASIVRIAQLARAAGIHLIVATQRPSANVVTGLIKSNIENRIAFSVASGIDSRVILDQVGAERLLGRGDMLLRRSGKRTRRVLGAFVSDEEIASVVAYIKERGTTDYHEEVLLTQPSGDEGSHHEAKDASDPLLWDAARLVVKSQLGSTSGLQRRLKVGYARAGRIMDMLEAKGIVGSPDGSKPRDVLLDDAELEDLIAAEGMYSEV